MFSGLILISTQHFAAYNYAVLYFLLLVVLLHHTHASATNLNSYQPCAPSSCGNIRNISYPFRLKTDPANCGNKKYELACENNRAVVQLYSREDTIAEYYVQAINYNNFTIRVVDAGVDKDNCSSIPHHSLSDRYGFTSVDHSLSLLYYSLLIFVTCANPVNSPLYMETSSCNEHRTYNDNSSKSSPFHLKAYNSYVLAADLLVFADLMDSCHIDVTVPVDGSLLDLGNWTLPYVEEWTNLSYKQVHDIMSYGFQLSWDTACCEFAEENRCNLNANEFSNYCYGHASRRHPITYLLKSLLRHIVRKDERIQQLWGEGEEY